MHFILLIAFVVYIPLAAHAQSDAEPKELLDLRESFERARTSALSPIERKYVDALTALKDRLAKRGDLDGALAVQAELSRLQPPETKAPKRDGRLRLSHLKTVEEFYGWLGTTVWKSPTGNTLRFPAADQMEMTSPDGRKSTYVLTIEKIGAISWAWSSGGKELMLISSDLDSATCTTGAMELLNPK